MHEPMPEYLSESNGEVSLLSFIVRLWKEGASSDEQKTDWRGHITHVPSGRRKYIQDLSATPSFIQPYLEKVGAVFGSKPVDESV